MGYGSDGAAAYREPLARGLARRDPGLRARLEVFGSLSVHITDDVRGAIDARKPMIAAYVGGMGSDSHNFHADAMARRGSGPRPRPGSWSFGGPGAAQKPSRRCPTTTSTHNACLEAPTASEPAGLPPCRPG